MLNSLCCMADAGSARPFFCNGFSPIQTSLTPRAGGATTFRISPPPRCNAARSLLGSEQLRNTAPFNAVLKAIAGGRGRRSEIADVTGLSANSLTYPLDTLIELEWTRRERSFGETTDRRSRYRIADPFLNFWYRFGATNASAFRFEDRMEVFRRAVEPQLSDYMGRYVFEEVCTQWLRANGRRTLGLEVLDVARYWSRDGVTELDQFAGLEDGSLLFGECKWSLSKAVEVAVYAKLRAKVESLPHDGWKRNARFILYSVGGFTEGMRKLAAAEGNVHLVEGDRLFEAPVRDGLTPSS